MNEFNKFLQTFESDSAKKIEDLGRIETKDIFEEPIWTTKTFTDKDGVEKHFKRIKLNIKGEEVDCPISVIVKLRAITEKLGKEIRAFSVVKTGEGLKTDYNIVPEMGDPLIINGV